MLKSYFWEHEEEGFFNLNIFDEPLLNWNNLCTGILD